MKIDVNYIAVVLSAIAAMAIGGLWYSPVLFGKQWATLNNLSDEDLKKGNANAIATSLFAALVKAFIFAEVVFLTDSHFGGSYLENALWTALSVWVGFFMMQTLMRNAFERKPNKLTYIAVGYDFVCLLAFAVIIGGLGV